MNNIATIAKIYIMVMYCTDSCPSWLSVPSMEGFASLKSCNERMSKEQASDKVKALSSDGDDIIITIKRECKEVSLNGY
jgi:hypothetical protein